MSRSNVDDASEQTHGRETEPIARGMGENDKSRDVVANIEARLAMANTREGLDMIEQGMKKDIEDIRK